jgi:hypothetical protein
VRSCTLGMVKLTLRPWLRAVTMGTDTGHHINIIIPPEFYSGGPTDLIVQH